MRSVVLMSRASILREVRLSSTIVKYSVFNLNKI
jgi:hypothetical protein